MITCVSLPDNLTFSRLAKRFKEKGIVIYNGKGVLKDKIFQIGHIGSLRKNDTAFALKELKKVLHDVNHEHNINIKAEKKERIHAIS